MSVEEDSELKKAAQPSWHLDFSLLGAWAEDPGKLHPESQSTDIMSHKFVVFLSHICGYLLISMENQY